MAAAYLLPRWVKWPHVGKNVTLFSYMVMQHAAHLEIYPLGGTWLVQERNRGGGRNDAYTVLWELRDPLLPASPRTDRGDRREIVSLLDIFVPLASNTLPDTWTRAFFYFERYFENCFEMFLSCFSSGLNMRNIFIIFSNGER